MYNPIMNTYRQEHVKSEAWNQYQFIFKNMSNIRSSNENKKLNDFQLRSSINASLS